MKVSVIIPCYNAEPYLEQSIGSVLCQSLPAKEVIVVDDGSTDNSVSVARSFGDRVQVISKLNGGAAEARNIGRAHATGEALMFLDADDVLGPHVLEALTAVLQRRPGSIAIGPWCCLRQRDGEWIQTPPNRPPRRFGQDDLSAWLTGWFHTPCSVLWSREAFAQVEEWDPQAGPNDDGDIMMRAIIKGVPLVKASHGVSYYRRLPEDESSLSDARHTEAGIRARMHVMNKLARMLKERGMLEAYGAPLGEAFERIASDCKGHSALRDQCVASAQEYGGPAWIRTTRRAWSEVKSKGVRAWRRTMPFAEQRQQFPEPSTVHFGLDWKKRLSGQTRCDGGEAPDAGHQPLVSVIIPTYNRAVLLPRALESVLEQTFEDFEVLVVDDASTDDTPMVMDAYHTDARVRYLRQSENRGVSAARNRGLREARGELIAFLDSDDEWMPHKIEQQVARYKELSDDAGLIYTGFETVRDNGSTTTHAPDVSGDLFSYLLERNFIYPTSGMMTRRQVVSEVGYFDEKMPANEDWDYYVRIAREYKIEYVDEVLMRYYAVLNHERKSLIPEDDLEARSQFYQKYAAEMAEVGAAYPFLVESARRHLVPDSWDPKGARQILWKAVALRPFALRLYVMFLRSLFPHRVYLLLRNTLRAALSRYA